jgi:type VI secretion system protein ImpL
MARLLITALKIFLLLALAGAAAFGAVLLARYEGWPTWTAAVMVASVLALVVLALFLRRYFYRRREASFIKRVVAQDQKSVDAAPAQERKKLQELQDRWSAAVRILRSSKLKHRGDPLYTLPWFMIFGETASGKSTSVSHARLTTILTDAGPAKGIAGTRNCDWWFFEEAVVLDTTGRYAIPLDQEADREEWERFLSLLSRYRRREPLSGLVVTLPVDRLLGGDSDKLAEYGRSIRLRVDQLMRTLGAKFPVYVLLTKLDLVLGMTALCDLLPKEERGQAMGLLNADERLAPEEFAGNALAHVSRRLKDMRLLLAVNAGQGDGKAALFPDEFERLIPLIRAFIEGAFSENPYQETPYLRGFFISSGRQSGMTRSSVLGSLESLKDKQWRLPDTGRGLFLHDFFSTILPRERGLFRHIDEYLSWRTATRSLGLLAWMLTLLAVIGLSSLAFVKVRGAMEPVRTAFPASPRLGAGLDADLVHLGLLRDKIVDMDKGLHGGLWPSMGFDQGDEALAELKRHYCAWFRHYALNPMDRAMNGHLAALSQQGREGYMAKSLEYLIWRIDLLNARERKTAPKLDGRDPVDGLALAFGGRLPEVAAFVPDMYRSYAAWEEDSRLLERERRELQSWAARLVEFEGANLHWLTQWANARPELLWVTLDDFWPGLGQEPHGPRISPAFTAKGKVEIEKLLAGLEEVMANREHFQARAATFWLWYQQRFYEEWKVFATDFQMGQEKLAVREDWLSAAASMSTLDNPYFKLLERMRAEFAPVDKLGPPPSWTLVPERFAALLEYQRSKQKSATLEAKVEGEVKTGVAKILGAFNERVLSRIDKIVQATATFDDYMKHLGAFQPITASKEAAFRFTTQHYGSAGAAVPSPPPAPDKSGQASAGAEGGQPTAVDLAVASLQRMRLLLGDGQASEEVIWQIAGGPLTFLVILATDESACSLNDLWQAQVLAEVRNTPEAELWEALFGQKGLVNAFVQGPAKPFLRRNVRGWFSGNWLGVPFPFEPHFLDLLEAGGLRRQQVQPKYTVRIEALPTNVNTEANSEPNSVSLRMQCAAKVQQLDNFNYRDAQDFTWEPATCGEVSLEIVFREATLKKTWSGPWGFRDFLRDFRDGSEIYVPRDFPDRQSTLEGLGITHIQVNYAITGAKPVLELSDYPPLLLPQSVAACGRGLGMDTAPAGGEQ